MRALDVAALALNASLYAALGYVFYYILPLTAPGFGTVRFWPSVIVPAVFAALFGPWVGGFGAAIGIFISDMLIHGNPILSLMAGVTSNFAMFAIIGYVAKKKIDWKISMLAFGMLSGLLIWISYNVLSSDLASMFSVVIVISYAVLLVVIGLTKRLRGFEAGCMVGLLVGSSIIGLMVPVFSQFFMMPGNTELTHLTVVAGFVYVVFTFATEIVFLVGPASLILYICYRAFPNLDYSRKGTDSETKG